MLGVFVTVFALVYTLDFVELLRRAGEAEGASAGLMAQLSLYRTPAVAEGVLPFAVLFGSDGGPAPALAQAGAGRRPRRRDLGLAVPAAGLLRGPGARRGRRSAIYNSGLGAAEAALHRDRGEDLRQSRPGRAPARTSGSARRASTARRSSAPRPPSRGHDHAGGRRRSSPSTSAGKFAEQLVAARATLHDGYWELSDVRGSHTGRTARVVRHLPDRARTSTPRQVRQGFTRRNSVPFWQLPTTIARTERAGLDATRYRLQYDVLWARPVLFVAMVLVAATVSLRFFRFGGVGKLVLGGVAAGFALYVVRQVMEGLGASGLVAAPVAAWFPAVVGSLLGTLTLLYQEDG
ncbi:LptF/LptG family permease [Methylobacterium oryzae CBMB20]